MQEKRTPHIYKEGLHYDLINSFDFDIPFYVKKAKETGTSVLELACGTGRVSIPLAKEGLEVVGLDFSKDMLGLAKAKAKTENVEVDWIEGDMTSFSLKKKFDTILCVHNSFCHLEKIEDVKGFFTCVKEHLNDDGLFVLQLFSPDLHMLTRDPEQQMPLISFVIPENGRKVEITESSLYDEATQLNYMKWFFKEEGEEQRETYFTVRVYFPEELDNLAQLMGFEIVSKYGDFDETPFYEYPDTQILVLRKQS